MAKGNKNSAYTNTYHEAQSGNASPDAPRELYQVDAHRAYTFGADKGAAYTAAPTSRPQGVLVPENYAAFAHSGHPNSQAAISQEKEKRKGKAGFWIAIVIAVLAVIAACFFAFRSCSDGTSLRDPNQAAGQLEGKTDEEIQAELNRTVEAGMFNISIASVVEFADGTSEGELRIENVPANHYLMKVTITQDETGQVIYQSGIIEPNHHVQRARLSEDLDAGSYPCTATFLALDPQTEEEVGQAAAKISINVLG